MNEAQFPIDMENEETAGLVRLQTRELRDQARILVIDGWNDMGRAELIGALAAYKKKAAAHQQAPR